MFQAIFLALKCIWFSVYFAMWANRTLQTRTLKQHTQWKHRNSLHITDTQGWWQPTWHQNIQAEEKQHSTKQALTCSTYLSIKARNICLSVCLCLCVSVCVCVCLKHLRSGSDWPEIFNTAAAWFKSMQRWICLDYNDTVIKWFHIWFPNFASIVNHSHHSHVRTRANHCRALLHAPPPESTDAPVRPNHVANLRWRSSKTQPPWVSVLTYMLAWPSNFIPVFCW